MQELEKVIKSFICGEKTIAIACSGGVDSMFLAVFSSSILQKEGVEFLAIIIDHQLQVGSAPNALRTQETLKKYGVRSVILTWEHNVIHTAIEEKARKARYLLISNHCRKHNIGKVMLAHHIDDKIETFLMNSMRGTGLDGITSMRQSHIMHGIEYFRPMLFLMEKASIVEYMQTNNIAWVEDLTNQNTYFTRNNIRHTIKLTPSQKQGILQTAQNLDSIREVFNAEVDAFFQNHALVNNFGVSFSQEVFLLNREMFIRVVKKTLSIVHSFYSELRHKSIERLYVWLKDNDAQRKTTFAHCIFEKTIMGLKVDAEPQKLNSPQTE